ncbi:MAG: glycosyltransferase family 39 protein [Terriglobales bacterium]
MSSFDRTQAIGPGAKPSLEASSFLTVRFLHAVAGFADAHGWPFFAAISFFFGWDYLSGMGSRHLDHDELFTFYIAQAPSLRKLFALTHTIDLHPPLSYLFVRASFAIFGASSWSCRLPFLLAFFAFSALLFLFLSRLLSPLYGLMAVLTLWISPYAHLAIEARSYSMVLCFTGLMLVSWYRFVDEGHRGSRAWTLTTLIAGGFGLLLSHVLGVLAYAAFFCAESIRFRIRRKPDWRLWFAMMLPLISFVTYLTLLRHGSRILFSEWSQASPRRLAICYWEHIRFLVTPLTILLLISAPWPLSSRGSTRRSDSRVADVSLRWLLLFLFLVPLEIEILFARTGTAFYERYGVVALLPCAMLPAIFLARRTHCDRRAAGCMVIVLSVLLIFNTFGKPWLTEQLASLARPAVAARLMYVLALPPIAPPALTQPSVPPGLQEQSSTAPAVSQLGALDPSLPFVAGNGPTFLELAQYQDAALTHRLYLLTNHAAATTIVHATAFDHYELVRAAFPISGQVESYCTFLGAHPHFLVLGGYNHPDTWLLRKLEMDGAKLNIIGKYDDGVIEEHLIYDVVITNDTCRN